MFQLIGQQIVVRLRKQTFEAMLRHEISFFDSTRTGELTNRYSRPNLRKGSKIYRLSSDAKVIEGVMTTQISDAMTNLISGVGSIVLLFTSSWKLT